MVSNEIGRLPNNASEVIIVRPNVDSSSSSFNPFIHSLKVNSSITLTLPRYLHPYSEVLPDKLANKTVTVVGIIDVFGAQYQYAEVDYVNQELTKYLNHSWTETRLLTLPSFLNETLAEIYTEGCFDFLEVLSSHQGYKHMQGKIFLNQNQFNAYEANKESKNIEAFVNSITESYESWGYNSVVRSEIMDGIREYVRTYSDLHIMLFLIGAPVLAISFYLMIYSFELIKRQRKKQLSIIKTRGGSWKQIVFGLYGEMVFATIAAGTVSFFMSLFLAHITLRSTDFIEFSGKSIEVRGTVEIFFALICLGIASTFVLNLLRIIKLARADIEETDVPFETKNPFWKRFYLDFFIFILGSAIWISLIYLEKEVTGSITAEDNPLQVFFIIAPFLIFVGIVLIIGRLFYTFIKILGKIAWKTDWGIFPFTIKNIVRYKHAANRAALILTLAVGFLIISSSLIFSLDSTEDLRLYCIAGGDLSITFDGEVDESVLSIINNNVSHVESTSLIYTAKGTTYPGSGFTKKLYFNFLFVGVGSYGETVRYSPEFQLSGDLSTLVDNSSLDNNAIFYSKNLESLETKIGSRIRIPMWSGIFNWNTAKTFHIVGTFSYWPNLNPDPQLDPSTNFWIIGSTGMFNYMKSWSMLDTSSITPTLIIKADSINNIPKIAASIENSTGHTPFSPTLKSLEYKESFARNFNLAILNTNVLISAAVAVVCMIMFGFYIRIERGKEIGIERALGITKEQTGFMFLLETSIIQIYGLTMGLFTGMYFTSIFLQITQIGALQSPFVIIYPLQIIPILLAIFFIAEIGVLVPAYIASRTDISRILKVE
jgi:hypothetical protein